MCSKNRQTHIDKYIRHKLSRVTIYESVKGDLTTNRECVALTFKTSQCLYLYPELVTRQRHRVIFFIHRVKPYRDIFSTYRVILGLFLNLFQRQRVCGIGGVRHWPGGQRTDNSVF